MKMRGLTDASLKKISRVSEMFGDNGAQIPAREEEPSPEEHALIEDLNQWLISTRKKLTVPGEEGRPYGDPLADVEIWSPAESNVYRNPPVYIVSLSYDGAGNDWLNAYSGSEKYRQEIFDIADRHGFVAEDNNNWSMSFWPKDGYML